MEKHSCTPALSSLVCSCCPSHFVKVSPISLWRGQINTGIIHPASTVAQPLPLVEPYLIFISPPRLGSGRGVPSSLTWKRRALYQGTATRSGLGVAPSGPTQPRGPQPPVPAAKGSLRRPLPPPAPPGRGGSGARGCAHPPPSLLLLPGVLK